jgi:thymidylate kinase
VYRRRVVVSGLPGSGKSTLGRELARHLGLVCLDKDDYLEALFETSPGTNDRSTLSRLADDLFTAAALDDRDAVLVSFWRRPELSPTAGTPTDWLTQVDAVVEVFCDCEPLIAVRRFQARQRHPRHGDQDRDEATLLEQFAALAARGPLRVGKLVHVDTNQLVDGAAIAARVSAQLSAHP